MDKETFLRIAPDYYATAILAHLYRTAASVSREELSLEYSIADNDGDPEGWFYFKRPPLFEAALKILLQFDIIEVIRDPFGPPIISPHRDLYTKIEEIAKIATSPCISIASLAMANLGWEGLSNRSIGLTRN